MCVGLCRFFGIHAFAFSAFAWKCWACALCTLCRLHECLNELAIKHTYPLRYRSFTYIISVKTYEFCPFFALSRRYTHATNISWIYTKILMHTPYANHIFFHCTAVVVIAVVIVFFFIHLFQWSLLFALDDVATAFLTPQCMYLYMQSGGTAFLRWKESDKEYYSRWSIRRWALRFVHWLSQVASLTLQIVLFNRK